MFVFLFELINLAMFVVLINRAAIIKLCNIFATSIVFYH